MYYLYLQGQRVSQARNQQLALLATSLLLVPSVAYSLILKMEAIHSSRKLEDFTVTALRTTDTIRISTNPCYQIS
jgi:hypothetical protein